MEGVLDKDQRFEEGRVEAKDGQLNYEGSSDDEEIKLMRKAEWRPRMES